MERVVTELAAVNSGIPLWIKPNAGLPRMVGDVARYETGPDEMADYAVRFVKAGARVIGGCCGTSPAHTRRMVSAVR
jgi:methionine synthase I (cobalamin-dependent)